MTTSRAPLRCSYLLEKVRLIKQSDGERNFHMFYQLLMGCSDAERTELQLGAVADFHYLNRSGCVSRKDGDDGEMLAGAWVECARGFDSPRLCLPGAAAAVRMFLHSLCCCAYHSPGRGWWSLFAATRHAMNVIGFSPEEQHLLCVTLAALVSVGRRCPRALHCVSCSPPRTVA
jgi:hypothetical protein